MILVDTSVWVEHFRFGLPRLATFLLDEQVLAHPFVIGELACGNLRRWKETLDALERLPASPVAAHHEVLHLLDQRNLWGQGIGWIDAHLLASAVLAGAILWTADRRLGTVAERMGVA